MAMSPMSAALMLLALAPGAVLASNGLAREEALAAQAQRLGSVEISASGVALSSQELSPGWVEVHHGKCGPSDVYAGNVPTLRECEMLCEENGHCDAVSYASSENGRCMMHSGVVEPQADTGTFQCFAPVATTTTTTTTCVRNCFVGPGFLGRLMDAGIPEAEAKRVCRSDGIYYYDGTTTAVGTGKKDEVCDSSVLYCAGGETFGGKVAQAEAVKLAIDNDGIHPDAPVGAQPRTITECATTTTTTSTTTGPDAACSDSGAVPGGSLHLDFEQATLVHNNLGGAGPDDGAQELRYRGVARLEDGRSVDLVVAAASPYKKANGAMNGKNGKFGRINLLNDHGTEFKFSFESSATGHAVAMPSFLFSVADLDEGNNGRGKEMLIIDKFREYFVTEDTEVWIGSMGDGRPTFSSSTRGVGKDNPTDPARMSKLQANRMVTFLFDSGLTEFYLTYSVGKAAKGGRFFLFTGRSALLDCGKPHTTATTTTTNPPETTCHAEHRGLNLDFFSAEVSANNLGGMGPETDAPQEIRYENIAKLANGNTVDMVVKAVTPYEPHNFILNGKFQGAFGLINLQAKEAGNSVVLDFIFIDPTDDSEVFVEDFDMSILDLDEGYTSAKESVVISGFDYYYLSGSSQIQAVQLGDGRTEFSSSASGFRHDNPTDPLHLSTEQADKTVDFHFTHVSKFQIALKVAPSIWVYGRDFMFSGRSAVADCGVRHDASGAIAAEQPMDH